MERRDAGPPIGIKILEHMSRQKFHLRGTAPWRCATRPPKLRGRSLRWTNMRQGWEFLLVSVAGVAAVLASAISHDICHALFNFLVDHLRASLAFLAPHAITSAIGMLLPCCPHAGYSHRGCSIDAADGCRQA